MNKWVKNAFGILILNFAVLCLDANAQSKVAWLELHNLQGKIIQLEPDFYYAHVAIEFNGRWLHANPRSGVELVSKNQLEKIGDIKEILQSEDDGYEAQEVFKFLNRPFDNEYSWTDDKIYCAELVAKLLNISPTPMHFDSKYWNSWFQKYEGLPGASPSKLYQELMARGYQRIF